jgi:Flp pilus assembly pilin Flp
VDDLVAWKRPRESGGTMWSRLWSDDSGQGLTEYALLIALISLGLVLALGRYRNTLGNVFRNAANTLNNNATIQQVPTQ